jgi:hypothetical protein
LEELGRLIREKAADKDTTPVFSTHERGAKNELCALDNSTIYEMTRGRFAMRPRSIQIRNKLSEIEIYFTLNEEHSYSISGFPRCLIDDDKEKTS